MLTRMLMVQMWKHMDTQSRRTLFCNSLFEQSASTHIQLIILQSVRVSGEGAKPRTPKSIISFSMVFYTWSLRYFSDMAKG